MRWLALAAISVVTLLAAAGSAPAAIYWTADASIARANLDGSEVDADFIPEGGGAICAMAVDDSHLYWADDYENSIGRAKLDGGSVENALIAPAGGYPCGLAVHGDHIYWSNTTGQTIGRARLDGSQVNTSFIATAEYPCGMAANQAGLYWGSDSEDVIWRAGLSGSDEPEAIFTGTVDACGFAVTDSHLYWADQDRDAIGRANLDGSNPNPSFITGAHWPTMLAVHDGRLYWSNVQPGLESFGRADLDGSNVDQSFLRLGLSFAIAVDSSPVVQTSPPRPQESKFSFAKVRRSRNGTVWVALQLFGHGLLRAQAPGMRLDVVPTPADETGAVEAGRRWLRIRPTTRRGDGSRCILRVFRNGGKVKRTLRVRFAEPDKNYVEKEKPFLLFKPLAQARKHRTKKDSRPVTCAAR